MACQVELQSASGAEFAVRIEAVEGVTTRLFRAERLRPLLEAGDLAARIGTLERHLQEMPPAWREGMRALDDTVDNVMQR